MNTHTFSMAVAVFKSDPPTPSQSQAIKKLLDFEEAVQVERLMSRKEVARFLNCHPNTVDNLVKRGRLAPIYKGRYPQFRSTQVEQLMREGF